MTVANKTDIGPTAEPGPVVPAAALPEAIRPLAAEVNAYLRELPRLLGEGEEGRFALIHGDQLLGVWDTFGDALEAGYERFGLDGRFAAQRIDRRDLERFQSLVSSGAE